MLVLKELALVKLEVGGSIKNRSKINTHVGKIGKGFDLETSKKYFNTINSFFKVLEKDTREGTMDLFKTKDIYSHLVLTFDFKNRELDLSEISTGNNTKLKMEDLYNAMANNNFRDIVLKPKEVRLLKHCSENGVGFYDLSFKEYIQLMLKYYTFNLESVRDVWDLQKDKEAIVWGILSTPKKTEENRTNLNRITPLENRKVYIPKVDKYISNPNFPVLIQKMPEVKPRIAKRLRVKKVENDIDEGLAIVDGENCIVDILKINNFWIYDYPLASRIKFFGRFGIQPESLICYKLMDIEGAIDTLGASGKEGILIRSLTEPCIPKSCTWYNWSNKSMITFKLTRESKTIPTIRTSDMEVVHDYNIDLKGVNWKYINISIDGEVFSKGDEDDFFMDKADFNVWSRILNFDKDRQMNLNEFKLSRF